MDVCEIRKLKERMDILLKSILELLETGELSDKSKNKLLKWLCPGCENNNVREFLRD